MTRQKFLCFEVRGAAFQMAQSSAKYKNEGEYGESYNAKLKRLSGEDVLRHTLLKSHVYFRDHKDSTAAKDKGFLDVDKVKKVVGWRQIAGLYLRLMSGGTMRLMRGDNDVFKLLPANIEKVLSHVRDNTSLVDFNIGDRELVVLRQVKNKSNRKSKSPNCCYPNIGHRVTYDIKMLLKIPGLAEGSDYDELVKALSAITRSPFPLSIGGGVVSVYEFTPSEFFTVPNPYKANVLEKLVDYTDVGAIYACTDGKGGLDVPALNGILDSFASSAFKIENSDYDIDRNDFIEALKKFQTTNPSRMDELIKKFKTAIDKKLTGTINQMKVDDNGAIKDVTLGGLYDDVYINKIKKRNAENMIEVKKLVIALDALIIPGTEKMGDEILKKILDRVVNKIARFQKDDKNYVFETVGKKEDAFKGVTTVTTLEDIAKIVKYELAKLAKETP